MVCSGNICRSPMAEVVTAALAEASGIGHLLMVDSAGTGDWHAGEPMDPRARDALARRGFDGDGHRARQVRAEWLSDRDLVLAADRGHLAQLRALAARLPDPAPLGLLGDYHPNGERPDVPDPYYGDPADFDACLSLIHACAERLVADVATSDHRPERAPSGD